MRRSQVGHPTLTARPLELVVGYTLVAAPRRQCSAAQEMAAQPEMPGQDGVIACLIELARKRRTAAGV
ncbi:MAG: hypothetical protein ACKO3P_09635 [Planctomycetaceae bacterium]